MLKTVILADNPLDPTTYKRFEVDNVFDFIMSKYPVWPETARLYHEQVAACNDITPQTEEDVLKIEQLNGPFYVIVFPGELTTWLYVIYAIVVVAAVASAFLLRPAIPNPAQRDTQSPSPNNELSNRVNQARLNGRIPDIYGTVRSTPDLIAVPYKVFINHIEVEHCYMCIGRGEYEISDVRDDTTSILSIDGSSVEVYAPFTCPNSGEPQLQIGAPINTPIKNVVRSNAVNGQVLESPNKNVIKGASDIKFQPSGGLIIADPASQHDFTKVFSAGDIVTIKNAQILSGGTPLSTNNASVDCIDTISIMNGGPTPPAGFVAGYTVSVQNLVLSMASGGFPDPNRTVNFDGLYLIDNVSIIFQSGSYYMLLKLHNPGSVNPNWNDPTVNFVFPGSGRFVTYSGAIELDLDGSFAISNVQPKQLTVINAVATNSDWASTATTDYYSPILTLGTSRELGPFLITKPETNQLILNFVALSGLYLDNGQQQYAINVAIKITITPTDSQGNAIGDAIEHTTIIEGSKIVKSSRAKTEIIDLPFVGPCSVKVVRVTESILLQGVVDEIKFRDLYASSPVGEQHFGNVTTVQSVSYATAGALAIKDRKLNMLVTRKIPVFAYGTTFTEELYPTNYAADILCAVCLDKFIGNRNVNELDIYNIYNTIGAVRDYFNTQSAVEFCYTFDKDNVSFEETVAMIASAVFCTAYRRGNQIKLSFEQKTDDSTLLFNHRNKLPGNETRTVTFGNDNDNDGVEYTYVDPADDAIVTLYLPEDRSAINPVKVESAGVRNGLQAWFQAWRIWNKLRYQSVSIEFEGTQEAALLVLKDRILVADNTRPDTQDGEVLTQDGLALTLSQEVSLTDYDSYVIFLQHYDGSVESIDIVAGSNSREVVLANPPRLSLALDADLYARTTFVIVGNNELGQKPFLVTEKTARDNFTSTIKAVNYSDKYYENDSDFVNAVVDANGKRI